MSTLNNDLNTTGIYRGYILILEDGRMKVYIPAVAGKLDFNNEETISVILDTLPDAILCAYNADGLRIQNNHPCWVMFENGNMKRPVIVGFLGIGMYSNFEHITNEPYYHISAPAISSYNKVYGGKTPYNSSGDAPLKGSVSADNKYFFENGWCWPIPTNVYQRLTSKYGYRNYQGINWHGGIDIGVNAGVTILAAGPGVVKHICTDETNSGGIWVGIEHEGGIYTRYMHMQIGSNSHLYINQVVEAGEEIGKADNTGSSGGNHLHFDIKNTLGTGGDTYPTLNGVYLSPPEGLDESFKDWNSRMLSNGTYA